MEHKLVFRKANNKVGTFFNHAAGTTLVGQYIHLATAQFNTRSITVSPSLLDPQETSLL